MAQRVLRMLWVFGLLLLPSPLPLHAAQGDLDAEAVFSSLEQGQDTAERKAYLQNEAGKFVAGTGFIINTQGRSSFDSAIPPTNRIVAMIVVNADRRVVCGLPEGYMGGELRGFATDKAFEVEYRGKLVDGQLWESEGATLYLYDCADMRVIIRKNRMRQIPEEYLKNVSWDDE